MGLQVCRLHLDLIHSRGLNESLSQGVLGVLLKQIVIPLDAHIEFASPVALSKLLLINCLVRIHLAKGVQIDIVVLSFTF